MWRRRGPAPWGAVGISPSPIAKKNKVGRPPRRLLESPRIRPYVWTERALRVAKTVPAQGYTPIETFQEAFLTATSLRLTLRPLIASSVRELQADGMASASTSVGLFRLASAVNIACVLGHLE